MLVRKLRLQKGWSQEHLAELVGVTPRTIQRIERGYKPGLETAKALASVFEVDVSTFTTNTAEDLPMSTNDQPQPNPILAADEEAAMQYVKGIKEFYTHLAFFIVFVACYGAVWGFVVVTNPPVNGVSIPGPLVMGALGWSIGLLIHGLVAFEKIGRRWPGVDWEKKAIEKKLGRKL